MDYDVLRQQVSAVNQAFYDRIYRDPWLRQIFQVVTQEHIVRQQTDFMVGTFGGPKTYCGRSPSDAHPHINVTEEMWQLRETYLKEAFLQTQFPADLSARWLKIDEAFKHAIVKKSADECQKRYFTDTVIDVPQPRVKLAR